MSEASHRWHAMVEDQYSDTQTISSPTYFSDLIMISHTRFLNVISRCVKLRHNTVHKVKYSAKKNKLTCVLGLWSSALGNSVLTSAFCGLFMDDVSVLVPFPPREVDRLPELIFTNTMYTYYLQRVLLLQHTKMSHITTKFWVIITKVWPATLLQLVALTSLPRPCWHVQYVANMNHKEMHPITKDAFLLPTQ